MSKANSVISIMLVDDHPMVRQGVTSFLETQKDIEVAGVASSGEEAVAVVAELKPDLVLMDLVMPGSIDGIEAIRQIKGLRPETHIIVLTSFANDNKVFPAIKAGADGYLLKDVSPGTLVSAIKSVYAGKPVLHPDVAQKLMDSFAGQSKARAEETLTPREAEVLELVACGLSNSEIAERLFISDKTVKTHVSNILHKLNLNHRVQAALYALNGTQDVPRPDRGNLRIRSG